MPSIRLAPAKINLTLEVLDRRADGYHGIRSLMVPLALADELTIEPAATFSLSCDVAGLGGDDDLVARAYRAVTPPDAARIALVKRIPTQAGLGGGSSDAAAVLLAAMDGAFGPVPDRDWLAIARSLGSDVPFFLTQSGALVEGTGERVTAVGALPQWHVVIVRPPEVVSTAAAYALLDSYSRPPRPRNISASLRALEALQRGAFDEVVELMHNDFQDAVAGAHATIGVALEALRDAGCAKPLLAGSGSCVFALCRTADERDRIASVLQFPETFASYSTSFAQPAAWRGTVPA